jgi:hypothetical protein
MAKMLVVKTLLLYTLTFNHYNMSGHNAKIQFHHSIKNLIITGKVQLFAYMHFSMYEILF